MSLLDTEKYLDEAEDLYLFKDQEDFYFELRKRPGIEDFYLQIEKEIQQQKLFQVVDYREVRENFAKISRPSRLLLPLLSLLKERPELKLLKEKINFFHQKYQYFFVKDFIKKYKQDCFKNLEMTDQCLDIFQYLISNKEKIEGALVRQIPHGYSTKLIGREKLLLKIFQFWLLSRGEVKEATTWKDFFYFFRISKTPTEYRIFAPVLEFQNHSLVRFNGILNLDNRDQYLFKNTPATLIVENWETFYYLSTLNLPCLLLWGAGWKASLMKPFLSGFPGKLFYWGDMDKEGFEIYAFLQALSHEKIIPLFMDEQTLHKYSYLKQDKEKYFGPFKKIGSSQQVYEYVCRNGWQIEQEQLEVDKEQILTLIRSS